SCSYESLQMFLAFYQLTGNQREFDPPAAGMEIDRQAAGGDRGVAAGSAAISSLAVLHNAVD
ncbi:hypothetical protein EMWEY_00036870, partial [Eimeria maxima]